MNKNNISDGNRIGNNEIPNGYQHYIALDWSIKTMAIARLKAGMSIAQTRTESKSHQFHFIWKGEFTSIIA